MTDMIPILKVAPTVQSSSKELKTSKRIWDTVPYLEFFWAYRYMYWNRDFNESMGEHTVRQAHQQKLWIYLASFRYQTTKQSYKIIR